MHHAPTWDEHLTTQRVTCTIIREPLTCTPEKKTPISGIGDPEVERKHAFGDPEVGRARNLKGGPAAKLEHDFSIFQDFMFLIIPDVRML